MLIPVGSHDAKTIFTAFNRSIPPKNILRTAIIDPVLPGGTAYGLLHAYRVQSALCIAFFPLHCILTFIISNT